MLDLSPQGCIPKEAVPAVITAGTGVSLAVSDAPPLASIRNAPLAGLESLPEEEAVIA